MLPAVGQVKFHLSWSLALTGIFVGIQIAVVIVVGAESQQYIVQVRRRIYCSGSGACCCGLSGSKHCW